MAEGPEFAVPSASVGALRRSCSLRGVPKKCLMDNVSRPLIALLVGTVAFFALWLVALKPSSSSKGGSAQGVGQYQSAINQARQAVGTSNRAGAVHGGTVVTAPPRTTTSAAPKATGTTGAAGAGAAGVTGATASQTAGVTGATATAAAANPAAAAATRRLNLVSQALVDKEVIALLFYNPAATDDRAVKSELAAVPSYAGQVVKLAVPVGELARYTIVTNQVAINQSPTLVLIDANHQASTIVGFADTFEIDQRVADALAAK